ncbi:hypothetical protein [Leptospira kmetyi]|uniref:hypothetical protein n=1 Tax=Leptospira kmetyi TaxID=408139 RepID=UPI0013FD22C3|nr:hypothetical protein [Leptospira kmetyi]
MSELNLIVLFIEYFDISVVVIVILNFILLFIRLILESKGYPVSQGRKFHKDILHMFSLAKESKDIGSKVIYFTLAGIVSIFEIWFILSAIFFFINQYSI